MNTVDGHVRCVVPGKGRHRSSGTSLTPFAQCRRLTRPRAEAGWSSQASHQRAPVRATYTHLFGGTVCHEVRRGPGEVLRADDRSTARRRTSGGPWREGARGGRPACVVPRTANGAVRLSRWPAPPPHPPASTAWYGSAVGALDSDDGQPVRALPGEGSIGGVARLDGLSASQ